MQAAHLLYLWEALGYDMVTTVNEKYRISWVHCSSVYCFMRRHWLLAATAHDTTLTDHAIAQYRFMFMGTGTGTIATRYKLKYYCT